ncbi:CLEC-50 protein, partial [Aphelenchoides avenae]
MFLPTLPKDTCGEPYSSVVHSYWLRGSVGLTSSGWSWSDGSVFSYTAWDNGQPSTASPKCLALSLGDNRWSAEDFMTMKPYICKVAPSASITPTPTCPPPEKCASTCPSGWTYYAPTKKCFK